MSPDQWLLPKPEPLACYQCGLRYGGLGWIDACVHRDLWFRISPTGDEGGILCITCMAKRCEVLELEDVPLYLGSGPFHPVYACTNCGVMEGLKHQDWCDAPALSQGEER